MSDVSVILCRWLRGAGRWTGGGQEDGNSGNEGPRVGGGGGPVGSEVRVVDRFVHVVNSSHRRKTQKLRQKNVTTMRFFRAVEKANASGKENGIALAVGNGQTFTFSGPNEVAGSECAWDWKRGIVFQIS